MDARPANDTVAAVRVTFRAAWVKTYSTTCAECGERDAIAGLELDRDGRKYPACAGCWRRDREPVKNPEHAASAATVTTARIEARLRKGEETQAEIAAELGVSRQWVSAVKRRMG